MPNPTVPTVRRVLRCCLPAFALALLPLAPMSAAAEPGPAAPVLAAAVRPVRADAAPQARAAAASAATAQAIDTTDLAAVTAAYRDVYLPAAAVHAPTPSPDDIAACLAGSTPDDLQAATLALVNYFRAMSQVPAVTFEPTLSAKAQQAALMMYANHALDHEPPSTWSCYTPDGAEAAGHSNLGLGYAGADVVAGYMDDDGSTNTEAGHRWWLQRPAARTMGNGTVGSANALWVLPSAGETPTTEPTFTSWPSAGYFPAPLEPAGRWSFSPTDPAADLSAATVSVTASDGTPVPATAYSIGRFNSLVFEVGHLTPPTGTAVASYAVTVSGVEVEGRPVDPYRYTVTMVDPSATAPPPVPPLTATTPATVSGHPVVGATLTAGAPQWSETGVTTTYRWLRDGHAVSGATAPTYRLGTADLGHRISVATTGRTADARQAVSTSSPTSTVTKTPSALVVTPTSPAVGRIRLAVSLSAGGAPVNGVVSVRDGAKTVVRALKVTRGAAVYAAAAKPGRHTYTVSYGGSASVAAARSVVAVTVRDKVAAHLTVSAASSAPNKVAFRVSVAASGQAGLAGSVKITRGSKTVVKKLAVRGGSARYTASKQPKGTQKYTVSYSGTASIRSATARISVKVRAPVRLVSYPNCDAMDAVYPHGVGKTGATDSSSSTPVTNFYRNNALYAYNDGASRHAGEHDLDRDNDGIACERL